MAKTPATAGTRRSRVDQQPAELVAFGRDLRGQWSGTNAGRPDHGRGLNVLAARQRDAGFVERSDAGAEPGLHSELAQRIFDDGARTRAHVGRNRLVAIDDDHARLGVPAENLDAGRAGISVAASMPVNPPPATTTVSRAFEAGRFGQPVQVPVEGDRIFQLVDAEAVLGKAGNVGTEQPAAGGHDQPVSR